MAVKVPSFKNDGSLVTLLNPSEKSKKYAEEMKIRKKLTNDFVPKLHTKGKNAGKQKRVSDLGMAYRAGYLQARKDSVKVYNSQKQKSNTMPFYDEEIY